MYILDFLRILPNYRSLMTYLSIYTQCFKIWNDLIIPEALKLIYNVFEIANCSFVGCHGYLAVDAVAWRYSTCNSISIFTTDEHSWHAPRDNSPWQPRDFRWNLTLDEPAVDQVNWPGLNFKSLLLDWFVF